MPKYNVWFTKSIDACVSIEANSKEEAVKKQKIIFTLPDEERYKKDDIDIQKSYFEYAYTDEAEEE